MFRSDQIENYWKEHRIIFEAPPERRIVSVCEKTDQEDILLILLDNGEVYRVELNYLLRPPLVSKIASENTPKKIAGDALYALDTNGKMFVSRDTAVTWTIDTLGFNSAYAQDFAIDSSQYVYTGTDKGLFKQHPDSSVWR
ncbi:MAG: hypothetical protein HYY49_05635 [Ignavibacteriales bacterium]|nr:hypothetical protein [Ignavibacteriales bacterium]